MDQHRILSPSSHWSLLIILCFGFLAANVGGYSAPITLGVIIDEMGASTETAGVIETLEIIGTALAALVLSPFINRISWRRLAIIGSLIGATAQLISIYPGDFVAFTFFRMMAGIGSGFVLAATTAVIATSSNPDSYFGKAFAIQNFMFAILLSLLPFATFMGKLSYFSSLGFLLLILALLFIKFPKNEIDRKLETSFSEKANDSNTAINWFSTSLLACIFFLFYMMTSGVYTYMERIGKEIGIAPENIGFYLGLCNLTGVLGAATTGWAASRFSRLYPMTVGMFITALSCMLVAYANSEIVFLMSSAIFGFLILFVSAYLMGMSSAIDPTGRISVAAYGILQISYSMGPAIYGKLVSLFGSYQSIGIPSFIGLSLASILLLPLLIPLHRERQSLNSNSQNIALETN